MPIITILIVIAVAAVVIFVVDHFVADPRTRRILQVVVIIFVLLWLLGMFVGGIGSGSVGTVDLD